MDSGTSECRLRVGMALLVPLYAFVGYVLWRARTARALFLPRFLRSASDFSSSRRGCTSATYIRRWSS